MYVMFLQKTVVVFLRAELHPQDHGNTPTPPPRLQSLPHPEMGGGRGIALGFEHLPGNTTTPGPMLSRTPLSLLKLFDPLRIPE